MAVPGASLPQVSHRGTDPIHTRDTDRLWRFQSFADDPEDGQDRVLRQDLDADPSPA